MKEVTVDVETTTFQKGNPFSKRNRMCSAGLFDGSAYSDYDIEYSNSPYGNALSRIKAEINSADVVVGFNIKFDLHWLRRYIDDLDVTSVWDCQLAEFILSGQSIPYPSLSAALGSRNLAPKLDIVRTEFWNRGLDTPEIPWDILSKYQEQDVIQTTTLYHLQKKQFKEGDPRLYELFKLQCMDLLVLQEAEFLGMKLDVELAISRAKELQDRFDVLSAALSTEIGDERINTSSPDHVSVWLYGGVLPFKVREPTRRVLKNGEIKEGERWGTVEVTFPRLVKPLDRTEQAATQGMSDDALRETNVTRRAAGHRPIQRLYSVDEATLRSLKGTGKVKRAIKLLLELSDIRKLLGTYYKGLPAKIVEMDWPEGEIHGQFNLCVVPTGRLSSSQPNLQNLAGPTKPLYITRY